MTNAQSNLLQLAKQGDPKAIAALMNRSLQFIQTYVSSKKGWF
jgi:hypothetical protein